MRLRVELAVVGFLAILAGFAPAITTEQQSSLRALPVPMSVGDNSHPHSEWMATYEMEEVVARLTLDSLAEEASIFPEPQPPEPLVEVQATGLLPEQPVVQRPVATGGPNQQVWLTFYYCQNDTPARPGDGGRYCSKGGQHLTAGVSACPVAWYGRSFKVAGDPYDLVYTCLDTGLLQSNQVDIWFEWSSEGWNWTSIVGQKVVIIWQIEGLSNP